MAAQAAAILRWLAAAIPRGQPARLRTMALAYEAAFAATVHPALIAANRS